MISSIPQKMMVALPKTLAVFPSVHFVPWKLPFRFMPQTLQLNTAEMIANYIFKQQLAEGELSFLKSSALRIQIKDLNYDWQITMLDERLCFLPGSTCADTTFSGDSKEFLLLASRREDPDTLFFQRRLSIEGNTELGLQVKNLIDGIDRDELPSLFNQVLTIAADFVEAWPSNDQK